MKYFRLIVYLCISISSANAQDIDLLSADFHKGRRQALRELMPDSSIAIIYAYPQRIKSNDVNYRFQQNPDLYYLSGINAPNSFLIVAKNAFTFQGQSMDELLFIPQPDPEREVWTGKMINVKDAGKISGVKSVAYSSSLADLKLDSTFIRKVLIGTKPKGVVAEKNNPYSLEILLRRVDSLTASIRTDDFLLNKCMKQLREVKQPEEIALMRKAVEASNLGHLRMMKAIKPGITEYQLQAEGEYGFLYNGCEEPGYPSICGGGENSVTLHYETNRKKLKAGEVIVLDMGGQYHGYSADITRTLPVSGKFSDAQKELYNLVLKAQEAGIDACKPGAPFSAPHQAAAEVIARGLLEMGITGSKDDYRKYFMHGTSHYLGLDVHDAGTRGALKPGTVITVEPGIYIPTGSNCDQRWWNIGIRIEDDVLITASGNEVLSGKLPKTVAEIEATIAGEKVLNK